MIKPVTNGVITSTFEDHKERSAQGSWGIDIGTVEKDPINVYFAYSGIVVACGWSDTFGNRVWIKLTSGIYAGNYNIYPHLSKINSTIKLGALINEGDIVGELGNTGLIMVNGKLVTNTYDKNGKLLYSLPKGRHLHFEIRTKPDTTGTSINPSEITKAYAK